MIFNLFAFYSSVCYLYKMNIVLGEIFEKGSVGNEAGG